jgi:6-phosphogluconolactonase (cycloisomerase 2 family)
LCTGIVAPAQDDIVPDADDIVLTQALPAKLKIDGKGKYTVKSDRTLDHITFFAREKTSGQLSRIKAVPTKDRTWACTLELVAGTYAVWAELVTKDKNETYEKESKTMTDVVVKP